ncbi:HEAT repeat domain-containing protein [Oscillatoria salina]|uniref:HEAT repeat domain-containing protein n=1 Tax=Oscillatoria salina TaxID=331517 RepID=UPI0013BC5122|nr:HEAT repeat domain-containing protein [Oscillatoria salina]MBZ8181034.1 HEAT repeat domain-containing protein [Oscillatoria salina IIICB1]NET90801.1 HEAT repeat domain-containing protein [Kamptonema sp. SIO1D9]
MTNELIQAVERANSSESLFTAVRELAAAREEEGISTLIKILGYNNPGAAIAAVQGLVELGEVAVPALLEQIDGYDYGARAWSHRALAKIGDPRALDTLIEAALSDFALSVRRAAAKGLGSMNWAKLADEEVLPSQTKALETLLKVCQDPEWVVRYAAVVGLEGLAVTQSEFQSKISAQLQQIIDTDEELTVQARAKLALEQIQN